MRLPVALAAAAWMAAASCVWAQSRGGADILRTEPGSAPVAVAARAAEAGGVAPLLTYVVLGLSGLAVVLGGGALAVALEARRRAEDLAEQVERRPAPALDARSADRFARLEAALQALSNSSVPPSRSPPEPARAASHDPFPPPSNEGQRPPTARTAPSAPGATAEGLAAWADTLRDRFARLALDPSSTAAAFIVDHRPRGALAGPEGVALLDGFEGAKLWAVRAPAEIAGQDEVWALTPGEQAVLNWSAHFASQRTQVAAEVFGEAFELVDGGPGLRLDAPALVRRDASGRLSVRRRGRLSGFRA